MMQLERQKKILDYLNKNRKATTKELSQLLDVSTTTIRTDLNQMDKENLITKTHGGAVYNDRSLDNIELTGRAYFFDERALENQKEKEAIANKAIKLIKNHIQHTNSEYAKNLLYNFDSKDYFKVLPNDYAKVIKYIEEFKQKGSKNPELDAFNKFMEER